MSIRTMVFTWHEEFSFRVQVAFVAALIVLSYLLGIPANEFLLLIVICGAVLAVELINTAIEQLCDYLTTNHDPRIGKIKDLGSGAATIIGLTAVIVSATIFIPRLLAQFL